MFDNYIQIRDRNPNRIQQKQKGNVSHETLPFCKDKTYNHLHKNKEMINSRKIIQGKGTLLY